MDPKSFDSMIEKMPLALKVDIMKAMNRHIFTLPPTHKAKFNAAKEYYVFDPKGPLQLVSLIDDD